MTEIKLTKKEVEKRNKVIELLSENWDRIEKDSSRYLELVKIGDWKLSEYSVWSYKLGEPQKEKGIEELNIWVGFEPVDKSKNDYDLKLMSEDDEITIREYLLIYRGGRFNNLEREVSWLCAKLSDDRKDYLKELAELKDQEELKTMGYEAYVDKKLSEDRKLKDKEDDGEEEKQRNQHYRQLAKELLTEWKWVVGGWIREKRNRFDKLEADAEAKGEVFHKWMIEDLIEKIVKKHWNTNSDAINETVKKLHGSDKYKELTIKYRDKDDCDINYYDKLGKDIKETHPSLGYGAKELGDYFGEQFLRREIKNIVEAEEKKRENWNEQQWKDYYPREDYGSYEEIRVRELNNYDVKSFLENVYKSEDFDKDTAGKYSDDEKGWGERYRDYKKEIFNRLKGVKENIFEGKNFAYSCEYCREAKSHPEYKFVARTKHNIIYTCSRCESSDYYITIKKWEREIKMSEARGEY